MSDQRRTTGVGDRIVADHTDGTRGHPRWAATPHRGAVVRALR